MHLLSTGVADDLFSRAPCDDLMTCSSFVEINPEKPSLLCANSLIDSSVNNGRRYQAPPLCVLPHGHAGSSSCTLKG